MHGSRQVPPLLTTVLGRQLVKDNDDSMNSLVFVEAAG